MMATDDEIAVLVAALDPAAEVSVSALLERLPPLPSPARGQSAEGLEIRERMRIASALRAAGWLTTGYPVRRGGRRVRVYWRP